MAYLKKSVLAFLATVCALGMGEVLVRILCDVPEVKPIWISSSDCVYQRSSNPLLSYELKANYRSDDPDLKENYESTNSHGLRDKERTFIKPAGVSRVLLLGDSVVEGHGIPESATMSRQLEELVAADNTEVLNFGVSGYCTRSEVELLETKGLAFDPDVVVLVFTKNDFMNFNPEAFFLQRESDRPTAVKYLFLYSQLFRQLALKLNLFGFGVDADPARWNRQAIGENNVVSGLHRLRQLSRQHGFLTLVAIWPDFLDAEIVNRLVMPNGNSELVIERLCGMYGIPAVRLSDDFIRDLSTTRGGTNPRILYTIGDGMHPSPDGCQVAAQGLKTKLTMLTEGILAAAQESGEPGQAREDTEAIAAAAAIGHEEPNKSILYNNLGNRSEESGDYAQAVRHYEASLREDGTYVQAHINLGAALQHLGRFEEALAHYQEALRINPNYADAHNNLGTSLQGMGRIDEALAHYQEALRIKPDYAEAHYNWGNALGDLGRFAEAATHYEDALRIHPDYPQAHNGLGTALQAIGRFQEALMHYQDALRIRPDDAEVHNNWGITLGKMERFDEAVTHFQAALQIKPDYAEVHINLGIIFVRKGQLADAVKHFEHAVRLKPDDSKARANLVKAQGLLEQKTRPAQR